MPASRGQVGKREGVAVLREQGPLLGRIPQGVGDIGGGAGAVNVPLPAVIPQGTSEAAEA